MHEDFNPALLIPLAGIALPLFLVPMIMAMKQAQRKRECEHMERMKSLELGRPLPSTQAWPALAAIALGAIMPVGVFVVALIASTQTSGHAEAFFAPAAFVSVCGVWAGGGLARRLFASGSSTACGSNDKHSIDPEAFDVVGRRG
jgi:hypothetical protein